MLLIQFIIIAFAVFALSRTVLKFKEGRVPLKWLWFWIVIWAAVVVVVLLPETTSRLAAFVGITRGVDLVVYGALMVLFYLVFRVLVKIEQIEQEITQLVRHEALHELTDTVNDE